MKVETHWENLGRFHEWCRRTGRSEDDESWREWQDANAELKKAQP